MTFMLNFWGITIGVKRLTETRFCNDSSPKRRRRTSNRPKRMYKSHEHINF